MKTFQNVEQDVGLLTQTKTICCNTDRLTNEKKTTHLDLKPEYPLIAYILS